jgi:glycosyltransferase involved in cell wall biosynthesis
VKTVSCIIPAYNEATRIGRVLAVATTHPLVRETIAVDDGSTDGTAAAIARFERATLIRLEKNAGKSGAVCEGIRRSTGEILLFLDADLIGLTAHDVTELLMPVLSGRADSSISLRSDALLPWRTIGLDHLSGERVLFREVVADHLDAIARLPGFGLESYLNAMLLKRRARLKIVRWDGVRHVYKTRKHGLWNGITGEARMLMNIASTISPGGTAQQISALRKLRV